MFSNLVVLSSDSEEEPIKGPGAIRDLPQCVRRPLPAPLVSSKKGKKTLDDLTVYIDPGILNGGQGGQVLSALQAQDTQCVIQTQPVARSILWTRTPTHLQGEDICREKVDMIILFPAEEFLLMVHRHKENPHGGWSNEILNKAVTDGTKNPSLVILEMENYFRSHKSRKRQPEAGVLRDSKSRKRERKPSLEALPLLTRKEVEEEMIDFQLLVGFRVRFVETWKEFADFVCMFNKAVAEAPDKIQRNNSSKYSFYIDGEWAGGARVERCGKGLLEVWKRQIQQFNRVSVEIANAVVAAYPSPHALIQAYNYCDTQSQRHNLLSNILVRRGEGVTSTSRHIGKEISKRIYLQLTSLDPELLLELT